VSYAPGPPAGLTITVPASDAGAAYGLNIKPDTSSELVAPITVGQLALGNPPITSSSADCHDNPILNSQTCAPGPFGSIGITLENSGPDTVQFTDHSDVKSPPLGSNTSCVATPTPPTIPLTADLGPGNDTFSVNTAIEPVICAGATEPELVFLDPVLTVDGGPGDDHISGGPLADTLIGGLGNDVVRGEEGDDALQGGPGNDLLDGGGGNDMFHGSTGNDTLQGGVGNDLFLPDSSDGLDGADTISGGPGFDTVDYSGRTCPMTVTIGDGAANDGCAGEHDNIVDTDQFLSGSGDDHITGSGAPEVIDGGAGKDVIDGGGGSDELRGGSGEDTILAVDGVADRISCGAGADVAVIDLKDTLIPTFVRTPTGAVFPVSDCESVTRQAVDDSSPGRPLRRPVRLSARAALVDFRCPARSRPGCRGKLTLSDLDDPAHALGSVRYSLRLGGTAAIRVPLTRAAIAELRRSRHALVRTVERGHSKKGPRSSEFQLPARG
jgi:hypothetical protein